MAAVAAPTFSTNGIPPTLNNLPSDATPPSDFSSESMAARAALFTSPHTTATFDASILYDPLKMNLRRQIRMLLFIVPSYPELESKFSGILDVLNSFTLNLEKVNVGAVLEALSRLLSVPQLVESIIKLFRPLLVDLFARWLNTREDGDDDLGEERLAALAYVVEVHEEIFPILHEYLTTLYPRGPLYPIDTNSSTFSVGRLHRLLLAYFRIQQVNRELPSLLSWSLSPLSKIIWSTDCNCDDNGVRLLAIRCYAYQSCMGEAERERFERKVLGMKEDETCSIDCWVSAGGYGKKDEEGKEGALDGWILPMSEVERVRKLRKSLSHVGLEEYYAFEEGEEQIYVEESSLSSRVANIHGVLLLRQSKAAARPSALIPTPTSITSLRALALLISMRNATLLTSSPSAGKALLLTHLAGILFPETKNQIITIHLADTSLDPRSLLGSYISSPTHPGNFEWKDGVLVRAMHEGRWVVFEDIDRGSQEVLGVIKPLVESLRLGNWIGAPAKLDVPSRGCVVAHQNFLVFATRSVQPSRNGKFTPPTFFGAHKFCEIIISAPQGRELKMIVERKFERLHGRAAEGLIDLWEAVKGLGTAAGVRDVGLRELEKLCSRVERLLPISHQAMDIDTPEGEAVSLWNVFPNPSLREEIYLEARDVFFGAGASTASAKAHLGALAAIVGEKLGLDQERREWLLSGRTPRLDIEKDVNGNVIGVSVGTVRLPAAKQRKDPLPSRPFAMHRPAVCLLSRLMTSAVLSEPILLTGETGTGKTSVITHLASLLGKSLISLNLSHQTESSDLIGGLKPVDTRVPASVLYETFLELFGTTFSRKKNEKFEVEVRKAMNEGRWKRVVGLWRESGRLAKERLTSKKAEEASRANLGHEKFDVPRKRRKVESTASLTAWDSFLKGVDEFEVQHIHGKGKFAFGFVEGPLVKALRLGNWILLDEINLASPETLECVTGLLHGPTASITLTEQGSLEPVPRHADFRLFACMNPATDVGKKDLPSNIRSRFTEIEVPPPDADRDTLLSIINQYIGPSAAGDKGAIMNVAELYMAVKKLAEKRQLADGANHRPHFSMRTLTRAMTFAADMASTHGLRRSLWEGCLMAFTMVLDPPSAEIVIGLMHKHLLVGTANPKSMLRMKPSVPHGRSSEEFVKFGPFFLERGPYPEDPMEDYIMTPSVETKLVDLARITTTRRFPVLIEGPTSSGKTSSVEYLARRTGHRFVRINNHEHTDIQEYLGSYVSDPLTGKLVFKDGLLVHALRNGDWIVLDELNLAPTDVLEALNRLLDDNRELVIPETQEIVRPHSHFMLFATQNPPGLYAGRKVLSRAFRNRFLEVHFQDVPQAELESILCQRCKIAPSYGKRIVAVFRELQKRRQASRVFESKQGFATLRDLFRWANRDAVGYQELADNGYMLLAERARREDDKSVVKEVIESIMGVRINEDVLYNLNQPGVDMAEFLGSPVPLTRTIIWTKAMQRLYILVSRALKFNEPVLLVGDTGSGKTSVCQVFADATGQRLHALNCHRNTETADIIGALRPVRNRTALETEVFQEASSALAATGIQSDNSFESLAASLSDALKLASTSVDHNRLAAAHTRLLRLQSIFEWHDGPLVEAMRNGEVFLLDEISLADDSVLERLNSVLEPERTIVLAEKGGGDMAHPIVTAARPFKLVATMNPGGDYGKKELSPALRNRFTEIWVPRVDDRADLELIVGSLWKHTDLKPFTPKVLDYTEWLGARVGDKSITSLRDIIAWVMFTNAVCSYESTDYIPATEVFHHAAQMTYLDGLGSLPQLSTYSLSALAQLKEEATRQLHALVPLAKSDTHGPIFDPVVYIQLGSFAIKKGPEVPEHQLFNLTAPTSRNNAMRILRGCQLPKPILLEGSPGVGKTSLVAALANISGHQLHRINLSDQTDLVDLFGSDFPVEGGSPGEFAWRDAEFLKALQQGHWVLLDEMNLAPQAILEGLNAILDHRGTVFIPELGRSFTCHPSFRIFAAQNPLSQGGGRKGLPKSFVNRFTKVYIDELTPADINLVCQHMFPRIDEDILRAMVVFNNHLNDEVAIRKMFGRMGTPWEFNLRDIMRWAHLLVSPGRQQTPATYLRSIYLQRFRTNDDRRRAQEMFDNIFATTSSHFQEVPSSFSSSSHFQIGHFSTLRCNYSMCSRPRRLIKSQLSALETVGDCVSQSWLCIINGPRDSGKSYCIRALADFTGNLLREISINSATDTMDIIGSFEQVDTRTQAVAVVRDVLSLTDLALRNLERAKNLQNLLFFRDTLQLTISGTVTEDSIASLLHQTSNLISGLSAQSLVIPQDILDRIRALSASPSSTGRFEWVDGPLIQAMRRGEWLLLDGANLCNPSVLDRLNSLCEPNGQLSLNERGLIQDAVEIVKPHANFRLFMTVDPQSGELSRAMRNRGVEVFLPMGLLPDDYLVILDHLRLPHLETTVKHSAVLSLEHQSSRRGLMRSHTLQTDTVASSGRLLDQFSALSSVMDRFPMYLLPSNMIDLDASTFFLFRTFHHAHAPYFRRILDAWHGMNEGSKKNLRKFVDTSSNSPLLSVISSVRNTLTQLSGYPCEILSAHGPDDLVNELWKNSEVPSANRTLHVLDFAAAIFLQNGNQGTENPQSMMTNLSAQQMRGSVEEFLTCLFHFNENFFALLSASKSPTSLSDALPFILVVNRLGRDLRRISTEVPLNHSAVQTLACMICDATKGAPAQAHPLDSYAGRLREAVFPSSNAGLIEAWSKWGYEDVILIANDRNVQLDNLARSPSNTNVPSDTRLQALRLMSVLPLTAKSPQHQLQLADIISLLRQSTKDNTVDCNPVDVVLSTLVPGVLSNAFGRDTLEHFLNVVCRIPQESLLPYIPIQQMLWTLEAGADISAKYMQSISTWLESLFRPSDKAEIGVDHLLQPSQLNGAMRLSNIDQFALETMEAYEQNIDLYLDITLMDTTVSRQDLLGLLLRNVLSMVIKCFHEANSPAPLTKAGDDLMASLDALLHPGLDSSPLLGIFQRHLAPLKLLPSHIIQQKPYFLGYGWVSIGMAFLDLLVPETPIDPVIVKNTTAVLQKGEHNRISTEIDLHRLLQHIVSGNGDNFILSVLHQRLDNIADSVTDIVAVPDRDNIAHLHAYWAEVWQFKNRVVTESKITDLLNSFSTKNEAAILRERVLQESITGFYQRLDTVYPEFRDLNMLLKLAMSQLRLGVRLISKASTINPNAAATAATLLHYPSIRGCPEHLPNYKDSILTAFDSVYLDLLWSAAQAMAETKTTNLLPRLEQSYNQVLGLWLIDRAKQSESEAASQSLYRGSMLEHSAMTDAEIEERDFLSLFPSFENSLAGESGTPNQATRFPKNISDPAMVQVANLHLALFSTHLHEGLREVNSTRKKLLAEITSSYIHELPESLDAVALPYRLRFVHDARADIRIPAEQHASYNFYKDPNIPELRSATQVVLSLRSCLKKLVDAWPEQMVLQHLIDRCNIVLGFSLKSPTAKVLSALEQLLLQTDDWEMYANRDNSLSSHRQSLTELIVRWRRLELNCWSGLLQSETRVFAEGASEWWFRLYEANVRGPLEVVNSSEADEYLARLVPLIDEFLSSSPLGQFSFRIRLLHSFERYISEMLATKHDLLEHCLRRVLCIIHTTLRYYRLYEPTLQSYLDEKRAVLNKDIKNFIKLASWKDVNVQALKQSAQKTHHQLYKIVRRFREVLREPINHRISVALSVFPKIQPLSKTLWPHTNDHIFHFPPDFALRPTGPLSNLNSTFRKFEIAIQSKLVPVVSRRRKNYADDLAISVITISKELSEAPVPNNLSTEKRMKFLKSLLVRKRKAFSDLLKELKNAGLAGNVKADILRQNSNALWLKDQPILTNTLTDFDVEKSEVYFFRLIECLPKLRSSLSDHHQDLQTRELQRGLSFLDSGFSTAVDLRTRLAAASTEYSRLRDICSRLSSLSTSEVDIFQGNLPSEIAMVARLMCRASSAFTEIIQDLNVFKDVQKQALKETPLDEVEAHLMDCNALKDGLQQVLDAIGVTPIPALRKDEREIVSKSLNFFGSCVSLLEKWTLAYPHLRYLFEPTREWLSSEEGVHVQLKPSCDKPSGSLPDAVLNTLLYTAQVMITEAKKVDVDPPGVEEAEQQILKAHREIRTFTNLLSLDRVLGQVNALLGNISTREDLKHVLQCIVPFLATYRKLVENQLAVHAQWTHTLFKLDFVLCSILLRLAKEGFCQPPETEAGGDGGGESLEADGTGLGEGAGTDNVSNEIEDESQVEGLKGEDEENRERSKDGSEENAVEMSEDFGGALEDVSDDGSQDEQDESDKESELDPEERIEDVDPTDPSALDEKIWGDEHGPQDTEGREDKTQNDHSEEQSGSSEVVAKENSDRTDKEKREGKEEQDITEQDEDAPEIEKQGEEDEGEPNAAGAPLEDHIQDANTLDLPDNMELDGAEEEKEERRGTSEDELEGEEELLHETMENKDAEDDASDGDNQADGLKPDEPLEDVGEKDIEMDDTVETKVDDEQSEVDRAEDENQLEEVTARPDTTVGSGDTNPDDKTQTKDQDVGSDGQEGSSTANQGKRNVGQDKVIEQIGLYSDAQEPSAEDAPDDSKGNASSGIQDGQNRSTGEQKIPTNPLRNLGDALNEIKQRFDEILNSEAAEQPKQNPGPSEAPAQLEYLRPDDDEEENMQALGPSGEEQVAKLDDLKFAEDETQPDPSFDMDVDEPLLSEQHEKVPESRIQQAEQDASALRENVAGAILPSTVPQPRQSALLPDPSSVKADADAKEDVIDANVEVELGQWRTEGFPDSQAEHMWRLYESMTHDLAYVLCEQLRLILEPTLATRLKGDFRTGKRLNMKKIIPYIASDYTKDKIWLRRTRPSQREYQILIALDDSRSMAESHSIHLAYQTLALISKALSRLEAGDIAIAKFGGSVDILHGFDQGPFSDQAGTQVVSAFTFKQKSTNVLSLIDTSLRVLESARERRSMSSTSAADLWQLEIIISDGICQDHDQLRTLLRKAEEQRVMIVFIILDSLHSNASLATSTKDTDAGSILTMTKAEFKNVDGKVEMQLQKYLDSFPFEYYVVLRNVDALPEVLSGTLKQFFERISEE